MVSSDSGPIFFKEGGDILVVTIFEEGVLKVAS